jgi:hypothetical protein
MTIHFDIASETDLPPLKWSSLKYVFRMEDKIDGKKRHAAEEIVAKLGQVDVLMAQGRQVADPVRAIGVTEVTYYLYGRPSRCKSILN